MLKKIFVLLVCAAALVSLVSAQGKDEVKKALLEMDVDDYNQIHAQITKVNDDSALTTGYAKSSVMGGGGGFYYFFPGPNINDNKPAQVDNITNMIGGAGGAMFNLRPNLALGGWFGGFSGSSGKKVINNYWNYSVMGVFEMVMVQFKPLINDKIIIGIDAGLGLCQASYFISQTDESMNGTDVVRSGSGLVYMIGVDLKKRLTNTWFLSGKLGAFGGVIDNLSRSGMVETGKKLNLASTYIALGMGSNF
ncbi:MAG: hypothetical protein PHH14_06740 [Candidatus Margulisbacteria bacterium]|nr:hypothetical protein [Candidatus Margulisiibacteriota bacterium]